MFFKIKQQLNNNKINSVSKVIHIIYICQVLKNEIWQGVKNLILREARVVLGPRILVRGGMPYREKQQIINTVKKTISIVIDMFQEIDPEYIKVNSITQESFAVEVCKEQEDKINRKKYIDESSSIFVIPYFAIAIPSMFMIVLVYETCKSNPFQMGLGTSMIVPLLVAKSNHDGKKKFHVEEKTLAILQEVINR